MKAGRFVQELFYRDCKVAVSPDRHALASSQKISLEKLANENWVVRKSHQSTRIVDGFRLLCKNACFSQRVVNEPGSMQAVLAMVAAGIGVSLAPSCISRFYHHRLAFIPIQPDPPRLDLVAARPDGDPPPTVAAFLDMLRNTFLRSRGNAFTADRRWPDNAGACCGSASDIDIDIFTSG
jgi:Transcriptional regulator